MTQEIKRSTRLDNMSEAVSEIRKNGVIVIENLFEPDLMDMLFNHLRPSLDSQKPGAEIFWVSQALSQRHIWQGREFSEHLLLEEVLLEIADGILLPDIPMSTSAREKTKRG